MAPDRHFGPFTLIKQKANYMKRIILVPLCVLGLLMCSCAASVNYTKATEARTPKPSSFKVQVFQIADSVQVKYTLLGLISVDDNGFTTDCAYDIVLGKAIDHARQVGADAIKIIQHDKPDLFSSCHRIKALAIAFD